MCMTCKRRYDVRCLGSTQTLASRFHSKPSPFDTHAICSIPSEHYRSIRGRRSHAVALDLRVSAAALRQRDIVGGWHRGRGTPPRDENKIRLAVGCMKRENPLIARSQDFEPRPATLRYKDTRDRYNIDTLI